MPKVIWGQIASPPLVADPHIAAAHDRSSVFARWRQCACPSSRRFLGPPCSSSHTDYGSSIGSVIFLPHSPYYFALRHLIYGILSIFVTCLGVGISAQHNTRFQVDLPDHHPKPHVDTVRRFFAKFTVVTNGQTEKPTER